MIYTLTPVTALTPPASLAHHAMCHYPPLRASLATMETAIPMGFQSPNLTMECTETQLRAWSGPPERRLPGWGIGYTSRRESSAGSGGEVVAVAAAVGAVVADAAGDTPTAESVAEESWTALRLGP